MRRARVEFRACLRRSLIAVWLVLAGMSAPANAGDPVAAFLERHEMKDALAAHLEMRLERADDDERETLILQLSELYASLLDIETDSERREKLERRSRRLLELAPAQSADQLRVALIRHTFRSAEQIAENHRLYLAEAGEVEQARSQLAEIMPTLQSLVQQLDRSVSQLERRLGRAGDREADTLEDRIQQQRRTLMQSRYMLAWTMYYRAFLGEDRAQSGQHARDAQRTFAELLMAETPAPRPEDISVDLRSIEALARAIVGMALSHSITSSWGTAINWLDLLNHEQTAAEVAPLVPGWRLVILLDHNQFRQSREIIEAHGGAADGGVVAPVSWLRLAAARAMQHEGDEDAKALARSALTHLAARGELQQVLDLAERFGTAALGDAGFAMRYIEGLVSYRIARDQHQRDSPTNDAEIITLYRAAQESFQDALEQHDADQYPDAAESVRMLIAWSLFYSDDLYAAHERFMAIADDHGRDAEEAMWMAIVALDRLLARRDDESLRIKHEALLDQFLERFPASSYAPTLLINRAIRAEELSDGDIERLLSVSPDHAHYAAARRRALAGLYRAFRQSDRSNRRERAVAYLTVALPMLDQPLLFGSDDDPQRIVRQVATIRQTLEIALHSNVEHADAARAALAAFDALDELDERDPFIDGYRSEIDYRRVQRALMEAHVEEAERFAGDLWERDQTSRWSRVTARAMYRHASRWWQSTLEESREFDRALAAVVRHGGRVLREFEDEDDPFAAEGAAGVALAVAEASLLKWQRSNDDDAGRVALFLSRRLLDHHPNQRSLLRNVALLAEHFGRPEESLDAWRRVLIGSPRGGEAWFEARFHQIRLLIELDRERAIRLLQEHRQLYPDLGPDSWRDKFQQLIVAFDDALNAPSYDDER
jgi:hypothetical protein